MTLRQAGEYIYEQSKARNERAKEQIIMLENQARQILSISPFGGKHQVFLTKEKLYPDLFKAEKKRAVSPEEQTLIWRRFLGV